jgi:hypothetical protein
MGKSRNRRPKRRLTTTTAKTDTRRESLQKQTPESMQGTRAQPARTLLGWLRENYPKLGGLVTGAPSVLAFYHSTIPAIHPLAGSSAADPFRLPFVIENKNPVLPMNNVIIKCAVDGLRYKDNPSTVDRVNAQASSGRDHIPPKAQANYFCAIEQLFRPTLNGVPLAVSFAEISVIIAYKTPILHHDWSRRFPVGPFIWQSGVAGDQWMEGPIIQ